MKSIMSFLLAMVALVTGIKAQQKDTLLIIPGSPNLQTDRLVNYSRTYDFFSVKDGIETKVGGLHDTFTINKNDKHVQGLRVCQISFGTNQILDSGLCQLNGLKPIYHRSIQTKKVMNLVFTKGAVQGSVSKNDQPNAEMINYAVEVPLFDSYYEDIIAKSINIKNGLVFKFPEYIYERGGTVWSLGQITGNEKLKDQSGNSITVRTVKFYELDNEKKIVRTTIYKIGERDRDILSREYVTGTGRIVMRKKV